VESPLFWLAAASLTAWLYLAFFHGRFWRGDQRLESAGQRPPERSEWPGVVAVVPARNEADVIGRSLPSLLDQDYPGPFAVVLVDDQSEDGTGDAALQLADRHPHGERLALERTEEVPPGWVGKMWAVHTGVRAAQRRWPEAEYLLLTDADVEHGPGNLRRLVGRAEAAQLDLVSLMVLLHCRSGWERLLIPAFVYFFQKLYPFPRINDPRARTAGAAGGCMLLRAEALERAGGIAAVRGEIIDDCALGAALKRGGRIWVGLSDTERSLRPYRRLSDIWAMVARSAYTQLRYSSLLLLGTVLGLGLVYLVPPLLVLGWPLHGQAAAAAPAAAAWLVMAWTFQPTLRAYRLPGAYGFALPAAGLLYLCMTVDSARRHWRGAGGQWKGRVGAGNADAASAPGRTAS
jgi:hopene-associated glycosyltransferase HpnB